MGVSNPRGDGFMPEPMPKIPESIHIKGVLLDLSRYSPEQRTAFYGTSAYDISDYFSPGTLGKAIEENFRKNGLVITSIKSGPKEYFISTPHASLEISEDLRGNVDAKITIISSEGELDKFLKAIPKF